MIGLIQRYCRRLRKAHGWIEIYPTKTGAWRVQVRFYDHRRHGPRRFITITKEGRVHHAGDIPAEIVRLMEKTKRELNWRNITERENDA